MPPATAADTSLHWVTFTAGDGDICDGTRSQPCTLEAVARARWDTGCSHHPRLTRHCAAHRDYVLDITSRSYLVCYRCGAPVDLSSLEPVR